MKEPSGFIENIEEDRKSSYSKLISELRLNGRSEDYIKKLIDDMKSRDARTAQNKQSTYAEPKRFNS